MTEIQSQTTFQRSIADAQAERESDLAWLRQGLELDQPSHDADVQRGQIAIALFLEANKDSEIIGRPEAPTPSITEK